MTEPQAVHLKLDLPEGILELDLTVNPGPQLLCRLAADMFGFCDAVVSMGTGIAEKFGRRVTCAAGCGACCCQLVPLSPPEAVHIADVVESSRRPGSQVGYRLSTTDTRQRKRSSIRTGNTLLSAFRVRFLHKVRAAFIPVARRGAESTRSCRPRNTAQTHSTRE